MIIIVLLLLNVHTPFEYFNFYIIIFHFYTEMSTCTNVGWYAHVLFTNALTPGPTFVLYENMS